MTDEQAKEHLAAALFLYRALKGQFQPKGPDGWVDITYRVEEANELTETLARKHGVWDQLLQFIVSEPMIDITIQKSDECDQNVSAIFGKLPKHKRRGVPKKPKKPKTD